jgi:hypothetical protein
MITQSMTFDIRVGLKSSGSALMNLTGASTFGSQNNAFSYSNSLEVVAPTQAFFGHGLKLCRRAGFLVRNWNVC